MVHSKNNVLIITEGGDTEVGFLNRFISVFKKEDIHIVPFRQNIKALFDLISTYTIDGILPTSIIPILKSQPTILPSDKLLLDMKYTDVFLIFDLDIQNSNQCSSMQNYLNYVEQLIEVFDDSTSRGQILINYPMMESFRHMDNNKDLKYQSLKIPADCEFSKKYCNFLHNNKLDRDYNSLTRHDFNLLAATNLKKANYVVVGTYTRPSKYDYEDNLTQRHIFEKQKDLILNHNSMFVLNTALFFYVDLFGRELFFNPQKDYLY